MYNTYGYNNNLNNLSYNVAGSGIWTVIALILAIIGAFLVYFMFAKPKKEYPNKFLNWLRSFLNFQEMLIEPILKVSYIFVALFITLTSFNFISVHFLMFLAYLIVGNLIARVIYEWLLILLSIWKNTKEINKKMK